MYLWGFVIAALVLLLTASLLAVSAATAPIDVDDGPNQVEQPFAAIGHRAHDYAHHMMSKFASRAMALATGVGASCGSADGTSCQQCMLNGECDWCESSATCVGRYDAYETCADTWIRASEDCWLLDVEPTCQPYGIGCTDLQAFNYDFHATTYDESCVYQSAWGPTDNDTCSRKCACSVGGLVREYGKFCSIGYFGCPGEQPCDALDLCCQMHDWCVTVESYTSCECGNMLHQCVTSLTEDDYLSSSCPDSMKRTAQDIAAETEAQILVECLNHQDFYSKCGPEVNCNGVGSCLFNGGCDCGANTGQHWAYDQWGRTNCKCLPNYYPQCGDDSSTLCQTYCDTETCNKAGLCDSTGSCRCFSAYTGIFCEQVAEGYSSIYKYVTPTTLNSLLLGVGALVICIVTVVTSAAVVVFVVRNHHKKYPTTPEPHPLVELS